MNKRNHRLAPFALIALVAAALACNAGQQPTEVPVSESRVATAVVQTPEAVPTATAPQVADAPTHTPVLQSIDTPTHTPEPQPVEPSPTPCGPPPGWVIYTVQSGEDLSRIALRYNMTAAELQQVNCLSSETIQTGQSLYVPYLIPTPTLTEVIPDLKSELYFGGVGAGVLCDSVFPPSETGLPAVIAQGRMADGDTGGLCLFGLPLGENVTVDLYAPEGDYVSSSTFKVEEEVQECDTCPPITLVRVGLWWPVGLPTGQWSAGIRSPSFSALVPFEVEAHTKPSISAIRDLEIDPFVYGIDAYFVGEQVTVRGTSFPPNKSRFLGIYNDNGTLVYKRMVTFDSQGNLRTTIPIEPSYPSGLYYVVVAMNDSDHINSVGPGAYFRVTDQYSVSSVIRDFYLLIEQGQYLVARRMEDEGRLERMKIPEEEDYVNEWEKSGPVIIVGPIDVEENGNQAMATFRAYYPKRSKEVEYRVEHPLSYDLERDPGRGDQRFGYWVFVEGYTDNVGGHCPENPPQRVQVGGRARVCTISDPLIVRQQPRKTSSRIASLETGTQLVILDGPICANNWAWWKVQTSSGIVGWVSEGGDNIDRYFICPMQ
jgi:LysM repeat protein